MKKLLVYLMPLLFLAACQEEEGPSLDNADIGQLNNRVTTCEYAPYTTGSTFTYEQLIQGNTETTTWTAGSDRTINGRQFIEVSGMLGISNTVYFNCENGEYTIRGENVLSVGTLELVYLKENAAVNDTWSQTINQSYAGLTYQTRYEFTFEGTMSSKTVRGVTYDDVIHIHLDTYTNGSGSWTLFGQDDYYWAKGVGLIEANGTNVDFELISYNIL